MGGRTHGPLAAEWRAGGRGRLGVPLERALGRHGRTRAAPRGRGAAGALERARRHGAPLAATLAAQARDARFGLARHAREEAARAGPKIQLVVALLLVPSVLLLVAAALLAALLGDGGEGALAGALSSCTTRWNERLACVPVLSRVTTRTPFTLRAAEVTAICPVPGPEADSSPSVAT